MISLNQRFDSAFGATGSVLDRVPLVDQLCLIHEEAVSYNIKYQELMFGINYEIPLSNFEKFAEEFHGNMTLANIEKCQAYLEHKLLNETLTNEEKRFLQRKMSKRFPEYPELFKELLTCSYIGAFCKLMDLELKRLENKLKVSLEVDIFDVNYPYTIKLLFEVMRHYSIGKFAAWLLGIANYLQKDSSKIVGATVDGPQKNENSVKYFKDQMDLLLHVFKNYKTRFTIHALEFSKQDFESMGEKSELADVLKVAARIGHGTMTGETTDLTMNLVHLKVFKKCFEICPTVNHLTSGLRASEMPIDF
ncbi:MAG: hypothetical protein HWD61_04850 [Parachlamydiaceae bacterium]|nr:MAG: hypothetical protein HWD61_04850 [Parachlamydiaceae bacterium]